MMLLIYIFLPLGSPGVALGVGGGFFVGFIYNLYLACRRTGVPLQVRQILLRLVPVSIASAVMAGALIFSRSPIVDAAGGAQNIFTVGVMILGGVVIYGITLFAVKPSVVYEIIDLARSLISRRKAQSESPRPE